MRSHTKISSAMKQLSKPGNEWENGTLFRFPLKYKEVMTDVAGDNVTVRSDYLESDVFNYTHQR